MHLGRGAWAVSMLENKLEGQETIAECDDTHTRVPSRGDWEVILRCPCQLKTDRHSGSTQIKNIVPVLTPVIGG